eukprot:14878317-Heterocapsa_arctica.AAC.1
MPVRSFGSVGRSVHSGGALLVRPAGGGGVAGTGACVGWRRCDCVGGARGWGCASDACPMCYVPLAGKPDDLPVAGV